MRVALALVALLLTSAAAAEPPASPIPSRVIVRVAPTPGAPMPRGLSCRDRIHQVRDERGLPELQRDTASPDEPLLIAAVDHRLDGCSVMVMYNDTSDVRPVPTAPDGPPRVQRLPGR